MLWRPKKAMYVVVPATYIELRALSIVVWMASRLSWGVSAAVSSLDLCIANLLVVMRTAGWPDVCWANRSTCQVAWSPGVYLWYKVVCSTNHQKA